MFPQPALIRVIPKQNEGLHIFNISPSRLRYLLGAIAIHGIIFIIITMAMLTSSKVPSVATGNNFTSFSVSLKMQRANHSVYLSDEEYVKYIKLLCDNHLEYTNYQNWQYFSYSIYVKVSKWVGIYQKEMYQKETCPCWKISSVLQENNTGNQKNKIKLVCYISG